MRCSAGAQGVDVDTVAAGAAAQTKVAPGVRRNKMMRWYSTRKGLPWQVLAAALLTCGFGVACLLNRVERPVGQIKATNRFGRRGSLDRWSPPEGRTEHLINRNR